MQQQIKIEEGKDTKSPLLEQFEKTKTEQPAFRKVTLLLKSNCGCGDLFDFEIEREVPFDSPLKDGDITNELFANDTPISNEGREVMEHIKFVNAITSMFGGKRK